MFTNQEKLGCIERELRMRKRLYPRFVATGKISQEEAEREVALMQAISADYRVKVGVEAPFRADARNRK